MEFTPMMPALESLSADLAPGQADPGDGSITDIMDNLAFAALTKTEYQPPITKPRALAKMTVAEVAEVPQSDATFETFWRSLQPAPSTTITPKDGSDLAKRVITSRDGNSSWVIDDDEEGSGVDFSGTTDEELLDLIKSGRPIHGSFAVEFVRRQMRKAGL